MSDTSVRAIGLFGLILLAASPAAAAELPPRAPGLWETSIGTGGGRSAMTDCVGSTDRGFARRLAGTSCEFRITRAPNGHLIQSACPLRGGMKATALISVSGDYRTAVGGEVSNELVDVSANKVLSRGKISFASRRLGECRPSGR